MNLARSLGLEFRSNEYDIIQPITSTYVNYLFFYKALQLIIIRNKKLLIDNVILFILPSLVY